MTRLIDTWNNSTHLMDIGLKILMVMPALLLQKPSYKSTAKTNTLNVFPDDYQAVWLNLILFLPPHFITIFFNPFVSTNFICIV